MYVLTDLTKRVILAAAVLAALVSGCGKPQADHAANAKNAGNVSTEKPLRIAVVTNNASDWWAIAQKGGEQAAQELPNVRLDFRLLPDGSAAAQKALVADVLASGVDGIAISPLDSVNQKQMLDDAASKTLLFTLDSDAPDCKRACYVGTDDIAAGKMAGEMVAKALPSGGDVMVFVGKRDAQNAIDRFNGLKIGLSGSKVHILGVRTDDSDTAKAKANAADALTANPNLAGMVGLWAYNGPAILSAVGDAGKYGKIQIVCFDEADQTLQGVKNGQIYATVVQQPYGFTREAIRRMALYLRGDRSQIPSSRKVIFPTKIIQKDNVDAFWQTLKVQRGH